MIYERVKYIKIKQKIQWKLKKKHNKKYATHTKRYKQVIAINNWSCTL